MASLDDLEARVTALEQQLGRVREDVAAARVLAGGADRDVAAFSAKLDAQKSLLEALRETQVEQGTKLGEHDRRFDSHDRRFDDLESEMRRGWSTLAVGQSEILILLNRLAGSDGS